MPHSEPKTLYDCFLCSRPFQFGPHVYAGRSIKAWDIIACDICTSSNWDGLVPQQHPRLIAHLKERGVEIRLNEEGWLPIPPRGY